MIISSREVDDNSLSYDSNLITYFFQTIPLESNTTIRNLEIRLKVLQSHRPTRSNHNAWETCVIGVPVLNLGVAS